MNRSRSRRARSRAPIFRLRGKGMPDVSGRGRGDLFFTVQAVTPKKLSKEQRALLEQLSKVLPKEKFEPRAARRRGRRQEPLRQGQRYFWVRPGRRSTFMCRAAIRNCSELVLAELDDFQPTAIQEPDEASRLRAFFTSVGIARRRGPRAGRRHSASISSSNRSTSTDEDWAARSQAQLRAVTVGRLVIAPPWDAEQRRTSPVAPIVIRPSMGFGTGHHATTRLTLKALQDCDLEGKTVLDIGCGSGVLAIAAVRLGARSAVGIDIDPDALANAADNLDAERRRERVSPRASATSASIAQPADVVVGESHGRAAGSDRRRAWPRLVEPRRHADRQRIHGKRESTVVLQALEALADVARRSIRKTNGCASTV